MSALPAPAAWTEYALYFGWFRTPLGDGTPDWHRNPFSGGRPRGAEADWWTIPPFDLQAGDVKAVWEASRMDWAINLAQQAATGHEPALPRLNDWLEDWCATNPAYRGTNWMCAQEASIRVLHLAVAALLLDQIERPLPALTEVIATHLRRIAPTLSYARGQRNNHATSEAAALFVGGAWLARAGVAEGRRWSDRGRRLLESQVPHLVQADGSFSQYSMNYQRLLLDTLSLCEVFRRRLVLAAFSYRFLERASAAARWMRAMVDPATGDAPNYGANDGANLLPLTEADYRDFRPAAALGSALFEGGSARYSDGHGRAHLAWLGVEAGAARGLEFESVVFDDGGQCVLRRGDAVAFIFFPRYRFRPSHCDALHVDLRVGGEPILRDGGTYGYAVDPATTAYFTGSQGHNTIQFDGREQMPRLGTFLLGSWLKDASVSRLGDEGGATTFSASYRDSGGAFHERALRLGEGALTVRDRVEGFRSNAVLRWRLRPGHWTVSGGMATDGHTQLEVAADVPISRIGLVAGWESRNYMKRTALPVLEVEIAAPGTLTTRCRW
jgi:hypothetical protein